MFGVVSNKRDRESTGMDQSYVNFIVGGRHFSMDISDIEEYPDSYFSAALKKEWRGEGLDAVIINRDSDLFRHVVDFHMFGALNTPSSPLSMDTILELKSEADFYNMPELVEACDDLVVKQWKTHGCTVPCAAVCVMSKPSTDLLDRLSKVWEPLYLKSEMYHMYNTFWPTTLHKSSRVATLNIPELLAIANPTEHGAFIAVNKLSADFAYWFRTSNLRSYNFPFPEINFLSPRYNVEIMSPRLEIVQTGQTLKLEPKHAGMFVWTLNSAFTGGAIHMTYPQHSVSLTRANQWLAARCGCSVTTHGVTSGTEVVMVADIVFSKLRDELAYFADPHRHLINTVNEHQTNPRAGATVDVNGYPPFDKSAHNGAFLVQDVDSNRDPGKRSYQHQLNLFPDTLQGVLVPLDVSSTDTAGLISALDKELEAFEDVVVCLSKLYSLTQVHAASLEGGDAARYDLLTNCTVKCEELGGVTAGNNLDVRNLRTGSVTSESTLGGSVDHTEEGVQNTVDCIDGGSSSTSVPTLAFEVSFALVVVNRWLDRDERCISVDAYLPDLTFGAADADNKRTTKLLLPINASSEVEGCVVSHVEDRMVERECFMTGLKVTKRTTSD